MMHGGAPLWPRPLSFRGHRTRYRVLRLPKGVLQKLSGDIDAFASALVKAPAGHDE